MAKTVAQSRPARDAFVLARAKSKLAEIDRQIEAFSSRKPSEQREKILKDLAHERSQVLRQYLDSGIQLDTNPQA